MTEDLFDLIQSMQKQGRDERIKDLEIKVGYYRTALEQKERELEQKEQEIVTLRQALEQAKQLNLPEISPFKYCPSCSKEFLPRNKKHIYCSSRCRFNAWKKKKD